MIISAAILSITSFFYVYTVASYFKADVYFFFNRVTYNTFFDKYVISKYADHIIIIACVVLWLLLSAAKHRDNWTRFVFSATILAGLTVTAIVSKNLNVLLDLAALLSFPLVISFLIYDKFASRRKKFDNPCRGLLLYVNYLSIIGIGIGLVSLITTILALQLSSQTYLITIIKSVPNYAYQLFVLFSSFSPILLFLLIFCFPTKLLANGLMKKIPQIGNRTNNSSFTTEKIKTSTKIVFLSLFMVLSIIIAYIPHEPAINKNNQQVGEDTARYVNMVNNLMQSGDPKVFTQKLFHSIGTGDRPLTLIFLSVMTKILPVDLLQSIEFMPMILGPALVLVVYYLMRELTPNNDIAPLLGSFLTAVSSQILISIYAGFYANWLALILGYLSFVFLFKFLKTPSRVNIIVYFMMVLLLLLSHIYTWTVLTIVSGIFLAVMFGLNYYPRKSTILLLLVLFSTVVIDVVRANVTHTSAEGLQSDIAIAHKVGAGTNQFATRWSNLVYVTQVYLGGQLSNFIILALAVYWVFRSKLLEKSSIFLIAFLSIGIVPLFVGDVVVQSRVLYDIPFQIPAGIALAYIRKDFNGILLLLPVGIWLIGMSIIAVSNLLPSQ